jgi:hypothetical protein
MTRRTIAVPTTPKQRLAPLRSGLAVNRHGQSAVIGALSRSERGQPISAF